MRTRLRRRVIVPAAIAIGVVAVVAGAAWYLLGDGRRMGSIVERALVRRTGLPITVERAWWNGRRLSLRGVRLAQGPALPLDVRVSDLAIDAGIMILVAPAGRTISIQATTASVTLTGWPAVEGSGVETLRRRLLAFLDWSSPLLIRARGSELRTTAGVLTFDLAGEKQATGLTLGLTIASRDESDALRVNLRAAAALGRALDLVVDVTGSPRVVAAVWPGATSLASPVAARIQHQLLAGGVVSSFGRLSIGASAADRTALEFTSRYDSTSGDLGVSRYALAWGEDLRLAGTARLGREPTGRRLSATARGAAAASTVSATGSYEPGSGAFDADVRLDGVDAGRVARRLGLGAPVDANARKVHARLSGRVEVETMKVVVDRTASRVN